METNEPPYEFYEETRKYPRIKMKIPVHIYLDTGKIIYANIFDISPDGIQIRCRRDSAVLLNPGGKRIDKKDNINVKAVFTLSIEDEREQVAIDCLVYYFVMIPGELEEDIAFGLQFKKHDERTDRHISRFIRNELEQTIEPILDNSDNTTKH